MIRWAKWDLSWQIFHQEDSENAGNFRHQCPKCYRSYKHRSHMIRHCKYECGIPQRFECPYCKHHLRQRTHVWVHIRRFHPNNEFYCFQFEADKVPKNRVGIYQCPNCGNFYKWKNSLLAHFLTDFYGVNVIPYMGPSQEISFGFRPKKEIFSCPKCLRGFSRKSNRNRHFKYECGHEPRFKCPYCDVRSKQTSRVYLHIREKHRGEKVFYVDLKA
ncbi:hypothetical protein KQX54_003813 [Cotesia glomerata]|uniref:C2H2-type domain-containing protein n=1 Tax=Cotesia glomerata TaxID=32391 RepID=A0AAV7ILQ3_COTGL|nr:hypothetical protein KQX54_003813 [Cotesia glomerata]